MSANDQRSTVQLLIDEAGNRAAVHELLDEYYNVNTDQSISEADLYLIDDHTLPDYYADLHERVQESDPVFCPVVLIRRADSQLEISLSDPDERDSPVLIDDIVDAPIDRPLLFRRLNSLLVRRKQSREVMHYISKLEESNKSLEQFAYAASHDLQEPLRMVSSYLQLIEQRYEDELDEEVEEFLGFAIDGADRMRDMIDGLLEYSRVDTQGSPLEPIDLNVVLDEVLADLQMKIGEHDAQITTESLPHVQGDADQLRQVFQNLLNNGIEYSGDERPQIRITADRTGTSGRSPSTTTESVSNLSIRTGFSNSFSDYTVTANTPAAVLDSRSVNGSSSDTTGGFGSTPNPAKDRRLRLHFRRWTSADRPHSSVDGRTHRIRRKLSVVEIDSFGNIWRV